jgi:hypothetical protein
MMNTVGRQGWKVVFTPPPPVIKPATRFISTTAKTPSGWNVVLKPKPAPTTCTNRVGNPSHHYHYPTQKV